MTFNNIVVLSFNNCCIFKVGLLGMGRSLQRDLNRIAEVADTSSSEGLSYVLTGEPSKYGDYSSHFFKVCFILHGLVVPHVRFTKPVHMNIMLCKVAYKKYDQK